ncbi:MAG: CDP-diacylglycerol--serine O-phosphatidyltransferase [Bacteroidetes bacterium]|nr:CDP-diacylglycerol--serine O-phosphatidyltransferase [Bacteroidota bacterium]
MNLKAQLPNLITLLNLLSGVMGILWVLEGQLLYGAYFVLLSATFDFFDGFAARLLKVQSDIGKELDSLADVVSFGVLPGILLFAITKTQTDSQFFPYLTLIIPLLSAYRLAKFNLDIRQSDRFIGLPTPANALFLTTLPHLAARWPELSPWLSSPIALVVIAWLTSLLLVAELPLIALKFKNSSFTDNSYRYALLVIGAVCLIWLQLAGIPLVILAYLLLSGMENMLRKK